MDFLPEAFKAMAAFPQFILYTLTPNKSRPNKFDKLPVDYRTGFVANAHDPEVWMTADVAIAAAKERGTGFGVGFVFTKNDPFWFLDVDGCLDKEKREWSQLACNLLSAFNGAAVEVSSSGEGLHIFGTGKIPTHTNKNAQWKLEFYDHARFVALTGLHAVGDAAKDCTPQIEWLVNNFFTGDGGEERPLSHLEWRTEPVAEWNGPTDDADLLRRALKSTSARSAFHGHAAFADLWDANAPVLAVSYPDHNRPCGYDESAADAGLAQHLSFWTGGNCERIRRLMLQSKLVREKWNREDYLPRTILSACGRQSNFLKDSKPEPNQTTTGSQGENLQPQYRVGAAFLTADQQIELFKGCVYIADEHRILMPGGYMLNSDRFKTVYGGYSMPMDKDNQRVTRNAWEAFTESQLIITPRAHTTCFRPDLTPGCIVEREGERMANIWWPIPTKRMQGDPWPMLNHIQKLCPHELDAYILLCYMAACVQYKGIKFQWCPLIQGVEGNGKTLLTRAVAFSIGQRYVHYPKASEIDSKFNDWLYCKVLIGVEDIYVADGRLQVMEALKPMITSDRQEIEPKGGAKITREICANFIINTNHKDGLRKNQNDRRFAPFYTAQQTVKDLTRDGMTGEYFHKLYAWCNAEGFAIFSEYLHTMQIPDEYNPAKDCRRAPITQSTSVAIDQGRTGLHQEITEQVQQGTPGFKGNWISSMALDRLLEKLGAGRRIPHNKRRELLAEMGYTWHPGLTDGRVNNTVLPDGGKPRLYITENHPTKEMRNPADIARAYTEAQKPESS